MLVVIFNDRFQQNVLTYLKKKKKKKKEEDALTHILQRATKQRWFLLVVRVFLYLARVFRRNEVHLVAERVRKLGSLQTNYAISLQFCIVRIFSLSNHFAAISYDSTD